MTGGRLSSSPRFATNPIARPALTAGCTWDEVEASCSPPASRGLWVLVVADVVLSLDSKSPRPRDDNNSFSSRLIVVCWEGIAIVEVAVCVGLCLFASSALLINSYLSSSLSVARPQLSRAKQSRSSRGGEESQNIRIRISPSASSASRSSLRRLMRCSSVSTAGCREGEAWARDDHSVTNGLLSLLFSSLVGLLLARSLINDASTCLVFCDGTNAEAGQTLETRQDTATAAAAAPAMARARWRRRLPIENEQ